MKARRWKASIPAAGNGEICARSGRSAASSIPPPRSSSPASSSMSMATTFRSASPTGTRPSVCGFRADQRGRHAGADARSHPRRDLAEALGQSLLQPHQRAHACDARRDRSIPRPARSRGRSWSRPRRSPKSSASISVSTWNAGSRAPAGRRAQDLDAAGSRARPADGDRSVGRGGPGDGTADRTPTPALDAVLALVVQRAKVAGLGCTARPIEATAPAFA